MYSSPYYYSVSSPIPLETPSDNCVILFTHSSPPPLILPFTLSHGAPSPPLSFP